MKNQYPKQSTPQYEYDTFTGGSSKTAELAIYYNVAEANLKRLNSFLLERGFSGETKLNYLAEYLWKASKDKKNSSGYTITDDDKTFLNELETIVKQVRNYHSHIWHDNRALICSAEFIKTLEDKQERALQQLSAEDPIGVRDYERLLNMPKYKEYTHLSKKHEGNHFLTQEGRVFLLSFFLTTGQMSQLLQRRSGSKRTDMPAFLMKHRLYKYYCHRDGASIANFHQEDSLLNALPLCDKKGILNARTSYKLISYLNDYPDYWGNPQTMPLYLSSSQELVTNVQQLLQFIKEKQILEAFRFTELHTAVQDESVAEITIVRTGTLSFTHDGIPGHYFYINFDTLHRLALLSLLGVADEDSENTTIESILIGNLKFVADNRNEAARILMLPANYRTNDDKAYLLEKSNQLFRGSRRLTEKSILWFEQMAKERAEKTENAIALAQMLIDTGDPEPTQTGEQEPIMVYRQDMLSTTTRKFRAGNRFMHYSARYLMDFAGDEWYWGVETFEMAKQGSGEAESLVKKKHYCKASQIPDNYRLSIENDHIFIGVPKDEQAGQNHERFYQLSVGPKAMKYLMAFCMENGTAFFTNKTKAFFKILTRELATLMLQNANSNTTDFKLLEKPFIPAYLRQEENADWASVKKSITTRVNYIRATWQETLSQLNTLKRAEKNRIIMDAYRLFEDWPKDQSGTVKFLRKNEYNYLSICHYSLNDQEKFRHLFYDLFALNKRKPPIPASIISLLKKSGNLNELLTHVLSNRSAYLLKKLELINSLPGTVFKKEAPSFCSLIGIKTPMHLQKQEKQEEIKDKRKETVSVLPYPINPMLVYKFYFEYLYKAGLNDYREAQNDQGTIKTRKSIPVFSKLRTADNRQGLWPGHYPQGLPGFLYPNEGLHKQRHKLTGQVNDTETEDILLWWMAKQYLAGNDYTKELGKKLTITNHADYHVGNLLRVELAIPIEAPGKGGTIYIKARTHQLDDLMFTFDKDYLYRIAVHYVNRCTKELTLWTDQELWSGKLQESGALPNGTQESPISYDILREELHFIRNSNHKIVEYLFDFEKRVLQKVKTQFASNDPDKLQTWLESRFAASDGYFHCNFEAILVLAAELNMEGIDIMQQYFGKAPGLQYRNTALHNDVPQAESFSWMTRNGQELRNTLNMKYDLHEKKDRTLYETAN